MNITRKHIGLRCLISCDWFKGTPTTVTILEVEDDQFSSLEEGRTVPDWLTCSYWKIVEILPQ